MRGRLVALMVTMVGVIVGNSRLANVLAQDRWRYLSSIGRVLVGQ